MKNVSHRNAPGAISAIALTVSPVRPSVDGGFAAVAVVVVLVVVGAGDIRHSFLVAQCQGAGTFVCRTHLSESDGSSRSPVRLGPPRFQWRTGCQSSPPQRVRMV